MKKLLLLATLSISFVVNAKTLKLATLAPEGTTYANTLKKMAKDIKKKTDGRVKFKIYYGGVAGDEPDVLRKVFVGQMHGGVFTGKTLGDIYGDVRSMEIPFNFYDKRENGLKAMDELKDEFSKGLAGKGFEALGFYEIGQVYIVSTKKVSSIDELKGIKIWSWEGDSLVENLVKRLELIAVPLALPDVLSSLSTGIIESAYAPPLAIMAMQWHTKVKYLIDFPVAYSVGALLVSSKEWSKVKAEDQKIVKEIAAKYIQESTKDSVAENKQALEVFKKAGIEFISFPEKDTKQGEKIRNQVISDLKGKLFSESIVKKLDKLR